MSRTLKLYLIVIALVAVLAGFSYLNQRTSAPMPTPPTSPSDSSCGATPGDT